jgi:hypothetical protein
MRLSVRFPLVALLLAAGTDGAAAQNAPASAGPSFLIFRYASRSSLGMYSGYHAGPVTFVVGMLHNPRSSYQEIMGAAGATLSLPHGNSLMIAPGIAYTNTGWYSQLYFLPDLHAGRFRANATLQLAQPLTSRGTQQVSVSPGNAFVDLGRGFAVGAAYYAGLEEGTAPSHGAGPAIQRAVPHGSVTLELVKGITAAHDELRLTLRSSF